MYRNNETSISIYRQKYNTDAIVILASELLEHVNIPVPPAVKYGKYANADIAMHAKPSLKR